MTSGGAGDPCLGSSAATRTPRQSVLDRRPYWCAILHTYAACGRVAVRAQSQPAHSPGASGASGDGSGLVAPLLHSRVSPAVIALKSSCRPRAKRASASIPQRVASAIHAFKSSPRRSRTRARKAWISVCARAMRVSTWQSWPRYRCASADRFAAGRTMAKDTARAMATMGVPWAWSVWTAW